MSHRISLIPFVLKVIDEFDPPTLYLCEIDVKIQANDIIDVTTKHIKEYEPSSG
jgi:hypothetical protein